MSPGIRALSVLYDEECAFCRACAAWLRREPAFVDLRVLPAGGAVARERFPELCAGSATHDAEPGAKIWNAVGASELVVVDDAGGVYRKENAYLICLWALRRYRLWAFRLSRPRVKPLTCRAFAALARRRRWISSVFFDRAAGRPDWCGAREDSAACSSGWCGTPFGSSGFGLGPEEALRLRAAKARGTDRDAG
jgi:predicted DCC family thiol-disulfide oxidoreductase YuxK